MATDSDDGGQQRATEAIGGDFLIPVLGCALTAYYLITTQELVWEARATAATVGTILFAMCAVHFLRLFVRLANGQSRASFGDLFADTLHNRQRISLLILVVMFIATIQWAGTTLGLFVLVLACMIVLGVRNIITLILISLSAAGSVYVLLIYLLDSRLPKGPVERAIATIFGLGA